MWVVIGFVVLFSVSPIILRKSHSILGQSAKRSRLESYRLAPECKFRASPLHLLQGHKPSFSCRRLLTLLKRTRAHASFWPRHVFKHFTWFSKPTAVDFLNNINRLFFVMKANVFSLRWEWFSLLNLIYTSVKVQRARPLKISALQSVDRSISDPATFLYYAFRYSLLLISLWT